MKKIFLTLFVFGITTASFAQEVKNDNQMTLEQRNELRLKKLTVDLDLNENQQKEMSKIIAEESAKREAKRAEIKANSSTKKELSADEKFAKRNEMLDNRIAHKAKMKKILNKEQFAKWESNQEKRKAKMHKMKREHKQKAKKVSEE